MSFPKTFLSLSLGAIALAAGAFSSATVHAMPVSAFAEDFEGDLSNWIDRNPSNPESIIVADPLNSGNNVLSFARLGSGGSIFTADFMTTTGDFTVSFDYLGLPGQGGNTGDLGGYFGISQALPGSHYWVAGTGSFPFEINLIDDGSWHTYNLTFSSPIGQTVRLMFEDWDGSGGVAGDVFFDNVQFNDASLPPAPLPNSVPAPGALVLIGFGLIALAARRRAT